MIFKIPVELTIDVPNDVQARATCEELRQFLNGPIALAFLKARGVQGLKVGEPTR